MRNTRDFVSTGVSGLDHVLKGGFLRDGFYLLQGHPGSGKTTVALQYLLGRAAAGERCLFVSLTESLLDLENTCSSHGWALEGVEICDLTQSEANLAGESESSVFHPADTELGETTRALIDAVDRVRPAHVVFDGLAELRLLSGDPLRYRRQLLALKDFFVRRRITVLLLDDLTSQSYEIQPESLVGGNIVLERILPEYGSARRRLHVTKVRGSSFREGYHDYDIVTGGVVVHPRLVAGDYVGTFDDELCPSGVPNIDAMFHGGLAVGTTTLFMGPTGVGKSTVAMQFVINAIRSGKKAAVYAFDEVLRTLADRTDKLCVGKPGGTRGYIADGSLHVQQVSPAELSPGAFAHAVRRAVEAGTRVVLIDSLNGYLNAMPEERFLTTHLRELFSYLNQNGVLTLVVVAYHGTTVGGQLPSHMDVSYLTDAVMLFRYFEAVGEIRQAVSVLKSRTGSHDRTLRRLRITSAGVEVGEPLRQFRGIMTGVPHYDGDATALSLGEAKP